MKKRGTNLVEGVGPKMSKTGMQGLSDIRRGQIMSVANKELDAQEATNDRPQPLLVKKSSFTKTANPGPVTLPSTSGNTGLLGPEVYSPLFQLANLNLPRDRVTMNAWCRVFYDTHPIVRNAINLHASFPISKINISCKNKKIQEFFLEMAERIDLYSVVYGAAIEFWKLGEVFPYAELDRQNNTWRRITILNPDFIHVQNSVIGNQTQISMTPDAGLKRLVNSSSPADMASKSKIPDYIVDLVKKGNNIPLDKFNISHLKLLSSPYDARGTSVIVSIFKDLMLYDKIREAKLAQADGMINPLTLVKLGDNADYRATQADLDAFRAVLEEAQYDKDFKIVTHAGVTIDRAGFSGSTLEVAADLEFINQNIYTGLMVPKSLMDQEGACLSVNDNEILTERGWVNYDELIDGDKVATLNPETDELEYQEPTSKMDYNFSGLMYHFKNTEVDVKVTDFHEMYLSRDDGASFGKEKAISIFDINDINSETEFSSRSKKNVRFKTTIGSWLGVPAPEKIIVPVKIQYTHEIINKEIPIDDYLELIGYYISEGHLRRRACDKNKIMSFEVTQQPSGKGFVAMDALFSRLPFNVTITGEKNNRRGWNICNKSLAEFIFNDCGERSEGKRIPAWAKRLAPDKLNILLDALILGDGHYLKNSGSNSTTYCTVSKQLANDVQEIAFKCGYVAKIKLCNFANKKNDKHKKKYIITILKNDKCQRGPIRKSKPIVKPTDVSVSMVSNERVFCVEVPNHIFITRSNGKVAIHGNSYASSSVGLEVLRQRYDIFRNMIKKWLEQKVFAPICELNDFFEYENGQKKLIIPVIDFNHMNLYDIDSYVATIGNYVGSKQISLQTLYRSLGLSKDEERRRLREEAIENAIFEKEMEILSGMRLSELKNLDPEKAIIEPTDDMPSEGASDVMGGEEEESLSLPGMTPPEPPGGTGEVSAAPAEAIP